MNCCVCQIELNEDNCFSLYHSKERRTRSSKKRANDDTTNNIDLLCDGCYNELSNEEKKEYLTSIDNNNFYKNMFFEDEEKDIVLTVKNTSPTFSQSPPLSPTFNSLRSPSPIPRKKNKIRKNNKDNKKYSASSSGSSSSSSSSFFSPSPLDEPKSPKLPKSKKDNTKDTPKDKSKDKPKDILDDSSKEKLDKINRDIFEYLMGGFTNANKTNKSDKSSGIIIIEEPSHFPFNEKDRKKEELERKRKQREDEELETIELEKTYEYEWLGDNIKDIDDLISLGQSYSKRIKKKRRYNLNIRKLNNLVEPLIELKNMIGLKDIKASIFNQIIFYLQELDDKNIDMLHTVIEGPPGVGKTHICHILAKIYKGLGFLKNDKIVSVKRDDFIAKYLGQTADKTRKKIEEALGGVLFIDEAYSFGDAEGRDSYSKEALDMLTSFLSEHPHDLICIVAGYKEALQKRFFSQNEGLSRRFTHRFELSEYNGEDLRQIFFKIVRENNWYIYDKSKIPISFFEKNIYYFKYNGGDMLTLFGYCKKVHSKRLLKIPSENELLDNKKQLNMEDIENGLKEFIKNPEYGNRKNESNTPFMLYS